MGSAPLSITYGPFRRGTPAALTMVGWTKTPMPETLETIALSLSDLRTSVRELRTSMDEQFKKVDARFESVDARFESVDEQFKKLDQRIDQRADEVKSHLEIKIEAVQDTVNLVYDAVLSHQQQFGANEQAHGTFTRRLDAHDLRILRLESRKPR